ncbi:MAG: glycosyltransferase family 4 protein [Desulfurococcaceae archaeon]
MKFFSVMYQTSTSKGQELLAQRMVKWAVKLGHEAWLITSIYHDSEPVLPEVELTRLERGYVIFKEDPVLGLPTIRVSSSKTLWPPRRIVLRDFISVLRDIDENIGVDLIITHSTLWNAPEEVSRWILWKNLMNSLGEETRDTIYGHMSHYQPPDPSRYSLVERTYRMAWNISAFPSIFRAASLIICLTGIEAEEMISLGARQEQIHLFPGGLDDELAQKIDNANATAFLEKFDIPENRILISYLGTLETRKNPLAVVRVAKRMRSTREILFVIAGRPGDQWDDIISESKDAGNVVITGELSEDMTASLIKATYLNIIMSKLEAFGLTQLEFMYGGVPVITSAVYGQKWLIRNNVDGVHLNGPEDIEGAANAIKSLVRNGEKRDEMGKNARERASAFLMSKLMRELLIKSVDLMNRKQKT